MIEEQCNTETTVPRQKKKNFLYNLRRLLLHDFVCNQICRYGSVSICIHHHHHGEDGSRPLTVI